MGAGALFGGGGFGVGSAGGGSLEGRHERDEARLSPEERRPLQCRRGDHRVLRSLRTSAAATRCWWSRRKSVDPTYLAQPFWTSTHFKRQRERDWLEADAVLGPMIPRRREDLIVSRRPSPSRSASLATIDVRGQALPAPAPRSRVRSRPATGRQCFTRTAWIAAPARRWPTTAACRSTKPAGCLRCQYDPSRLTLRHHQCDGYVAPYQMRALGNARAWEERDPKTHRLIAIHWFSQTFEGKRTIWMDGRPHPPAYAPHSWMGFSTGRFVGNALEVRTTHLKQGWFARNGVPESDQATLQSSSSSATAIG